MDILNVIHFQVSQIEKLLIQDLQNGSTIYNYHICEEQTKFLDRNALRSYITETNVENITFLKAICQRCINIIEIWNLNLKYLPEKLLKEPFDFTDLSNKENPIVFKTTLDYHAIYLTDNNFHFYPTKVEKIEFLKNFKSNPYVANQIVSKCEHILYWIKISFPNININVTPEIYLNRYLETGSFRFSLYVKNFKKHEFGDLQDRLSIFKERYDFIYDNLIKNKKLEFKYDTLDHLNKYSKLQTVSKNKIIIDHLIHKIDNDLDFLSDKNYNITQEKSIKHLKSLAIQETVDFFIKKYNIPVDVRSLHSHLELENNEIESQLKTNRNQLDIGEYNTLKNNLIIYLNNTILQISDYETDNLGIMTNGLNHTKDDTIKDYCLMTFFNLFHSEEIKKINGASLIKNENLQQQTIKESLTKEALFNMRNILNDVNIEDVYNYFKVLINVPNRNGEFYLTEQKLLLFIKSTFIDKKPVQIDFDISFSKDKKSVRSVFRKFEIECTKFEKNNKYLKEKYTKIMMETFNIFNDNDYKKWHEIDNKIPTIKIEKVNKSI